MKIAICGSCDFVEEMKKAKDYLESKGIEVFAHEPLVTERWYAEKHGRDKLLEMKPVFTQNHFRKIEKSDAVLIINKEKKGHKGYFGSNTLMELSVAFFLGKKIFLLNPIEESHPHFEEIAKIGAITLNNDLSKIG